MLDIIILLSIGFFIYYIFFQESTPPVEEDKDINTDQNGNITTDKLCLDSKLINNKRYVVPTDCNLKQDQVFNYSLEQNTIKNIGEIEKCFYINNENKIELKQCQNSYSEQFIFDKKNKQIKSKNLTNQCIQKINKNESLYINTCNLQNPNQKFEFNGDKNIKSNITIGNNNKCLEINGNNNYNNGTEFTMKECDSNINQQFLFDSESKKFKFKNKCINYNPITNKIDLWDCNNLQYQNFIFDDINNLLKYENKCVTINNSIPIITECKKTNTDTYDITQIFNLSPIINLENNMDLPNNMDIISNNITINKKCFNIPGDYLYSLTAPKLETCNLKNNQSFNYIKDTNQITSDMDKNKCMEYNNNIIYFENCNNTKKNQKYMPDAKNKRIKLNENYNKCIEFKDNSFIINTCDVNNKNQEIEFNGPKNIEANININNNDKCIKSDNNIINLANECNEDSNQKFIYNSNNKLIKSIESNKCLSYNSNVNQIELQNCNKDDILQQITFDDTSQKLLLNKKCITYNPTNNKYYLKNCEENNKYQDFSLTGINSNIDTAQAGFIVNKRKCLDIDNNKVVIKKCNNSNNQMFEYNNIDRTIKLSNNKNKCFDIINGKLQIANCNNSNSQKFYYNKTDNKIRKYSNQGECIDLIYDDPRDNNGYQDLNCYNTPAQEFKFNDDNYIRDYSGSIMIRDKCVDVNAAKTDNGTKVQIYDCNDTDAQKFEYSTNDYLIRSKLNRNKCLDFNGTKIHLYDCHGQSNQKFIYNPEIMNFKQDDKCIDLNRDDDTNGIEFGLITCKPSHRAQTFTFSQV